MKKMFLVTTLCALMMVFCGAPEETPKVEKPGEKPQTEFYYGALTDVEIQKFIKAMPAFKEVVKAHDEELESFEGPDAARAMLGEYAMLNKRIPELDAKLRAAGMPWEEFWPAFGKTMMATAAVLMDSMMLQMKEQMKGQSADMVNEMIKGMEEANAAYKDVPQGNRDLVKKYMKSLVAVFGME